MISEELPVCPKMMLIWWKLSKLEEGRSCPLVECLIKLQHDNKL